MPTHLETTVNETCIEPGWTNEEVRATEVLLSEVDPHGESVQHVSELIMAHAAEVVPDIHARPIAA